ncbi:hypothetical protein BC831DRAFT_470293, partial [Entophlyctis helioformis]
RTLRTRQQSSLWQSDSQAVLAFTGSGLPTVFWHSHPHGCPSVCHPQSRPWCIVD